MKYAAMNILADMNPLKHILDVPWQFGGEPAPWFSAQIAVMILATLILLISLPLLARLRVPRGRQASMGLLELTVLFIRESIARRAMGPAAEKAVPFLATLFCFILVNNLLGLVPLAVTSEALGLGGWGGACPQGRPLNVTPIGGTPTTGLWVCVALASMSFLAIMLSGYFQQVRLLWKGVEGAGPATQHAGDEHHGSARPGANLWLRMSQWLMRRRWPLPLALVLAVFTWLNNFVPTIPGVTGLLIWPVLLVLELIGFVARSSALAIRLLANETGGHILLGVLIIFAESARGWMIPLVSIPAGIGFLLLTVLELLVAVIQAYIFTFLSALFIGLVVSRQH